MRDIIIKTANKDDFTEAIFLLVDFIVEVPRSQHTRERLANLLGHPAASEELKTLLKHFENLVRNYCVGELDADRFRSHFTNHSPEQQDRVLEIVNLRKPEIAQKLIDEVNRREGGVPLVEWFDWNVSWVMGSSSLASFRKQLCTVTLACRDADSRSRMVSFEMDKGQVEDTIRQLEQIV
ncbi:uncharacterized protein LOC118461670 [Anopheles albimanus]|uniref:COMM domain-containing protein n=1 Tax=Anopheles albimanus TaxID=7167 RepID=A0A182F282_ANOAL|nr:uncharacterized protein LOC118461670 [Anopheles albimanus]